MKFMGVMSLTSWMLLMAVVLLSGCATSQPARDQAQLGVSMIAELEDSLKAYRDEEARSEKQLTVTLAKQRANLNEKEGELKREKLRTDAAGDTDGKLIYVRFSTLLKESEELRKAAIGADLYQAETAKLLKPIPSTVTTTAATQSALVKLAGGVGVRDQFKEGKALIKAVKDSLKDAKKAIDDAKAAAEAADASASN
jgi:hypothetical protein